MELDEKEDDVSESAVPADQGSTETDADEGSVDQIQALKDKITELEDLKLRMAAENQNTRKRLVKQQHDAHKYRHQDILRDLAEVIDNFKRAIESSVESPDFDIFHEGILMIEKQFSGMLTEKYNLERIGKEGEAFDPAAHEAMMMDESPDAESETVKQVFQAGYRLHDRVLRPAKVAVVKPALKEKDENTTHNDELKMNDEGAE